MTTAPADRSSAERLREQIPEDVLLIVPVRNIVMFPGAVTQISLGREMSINAAREVVNDGHKLGIILQRDPNVSDEAIRAHMEPNLCRCGTQMRILAAIRRAADRLRTASVEQAGAGAG